MYLRWVYVVRYVAWYESPTFSLLEGFVQEDVQFMDGGATQTGI